MSEHKEKTRAGLSEYEMRGNLVRLVFGDDVGRFQDFCDVLAAAVPGDTAAVIRGSSVTGQRWENGAPFDADGPGTSDLDLTLVGGPVLGHYREDSFYIPGNHTKPLCEDYPDIAPGLVPLRQRLMGMVHRPVNIQATKNWVMFAREIMMGQPYLPLFGKLEASS